MLFERRSAAKVMADESEQRDMLKSALDANNTASEVVQVLAQAIQQAVHDKIAGVVSDCLEAVFDDPYEFIIRFERKRNRTEAVLLLERDGLEVDPMSASGGGVVDVCAFALRVACLTLQQGVEQTIVLDEPFRFVSKQYRPRIRAMLEALCQQLGIQIIMVTHIDVLKCGKVIELK